MKKFCYILCVTWFCCSCSKDGDAVGLLQETYIPILCNVESVQHTKTRTLIVNNDDLQLLCTPEIGGEGIAIWGDYILNNKYVQAFIGTLLTYENKEGNGDNMWNYVDESNKYWWRNAVYDFRACFPYQALKNNISVINASNFSIIYDSESNQEDLLVAYQQIDTSVWNLYEPVPLQMQHALATLKFVFKMEDDSQVTNTLMSASLDTALKTIGTLEYNTANVKKENWKSLNASSNSQLYTWINDGIDFTASIPATAYTTPKGTTTTTGIEFCDCDGHVLIIPQTCAMAPVLNFATAYESYSISLGEGEVSFEPGKQYVYNITLKENAKPSITLTIKSWNELGSSYDINF